MISRPLNQIILCESRTGTTATARECACILGRSRSAERLGSKLNNTQDVERMDPECSGNGVIITSFGNVKVGMVDGRWVLRNQTRGSRVLNRIMRNQLK